MSIIEHSESKYYLVEFPPKEISSNKSKKAVKKVVEIVPTSWVFKNDNGETRCKYPDEKEYHELNEWIEKEIAPNSLWKSFCVLIIKEAGKYLYNSYLQTCIKYEKKYLKYLDLLSLIPFLADYEQAKRRLNRMCVNGLVETSSVETEIEKNEDEQVQILTIPDAINRLITIPPIENGGNLGKFE